MMRSFSLSQTQRGRRIAQVIAALLCAASLSVSTAGVAHANSRCNERDHTHGALWWKRVDAFSYHNQQVNPYGSIHDHENSSPVWCGHEHDEP